MAAELNVLLQANLLQLDLEACKGTLISGPTSAWKIGRPEGAGGSLTGKLGGQKAKEGLHHLTGWY